MENKKRTISVLQKNLRGTFAKGTITLFVLMLLTAFLLPLGYMLVTSVKTKDMFSKPNAPVLPAVEQTITYEDKEYPLYLVPDEDGNMNEWALVKKKKSSSFFVDPKNLTIGLIEWEGRWRTLDPVWETQFYWENFSNAWTIIKMPLLLFNTMSIALIGMVGTLVSCVVVAYGFSRFDFPYKNSLFMILISTLILPGFVTLVPMYAVFQRIGWVGTWLPLLIPHFFANAYNVFLLRQFFMSIPKELDEAAMIDGASPIRVLWSIIIPQSIPALVATGLFHIVWAWNDYMAPLLYLSTNRDKQPIALGIQSFNSLYSFEPQLVQAASLLGLIIPVVLFFLAQRYFMQGIKFTGVEK